jgi:hypothetical protein
MAFVSLRILFLNTDYVSFLGWLYRRHRDLAFQPYDRQMAERNASLFGTADFMSSHMRSMGHEAIDIHANNWPLQNAWFDRRGFSKVMRLLRSCSSLTPGKLGRRMLNLDVGSPLFAEVLDAQIKAFKPTILYNHDPSAIPADMLRSMLPRDCALVAQIASPRMPNTNWRAYDLVISSLPHFVTAFKREGVRAEYVPLAFEPRVLDCLPEVARDIPVSFVGGLTPVHGDRIRFLEHIAERRDSVVFWGDGASELPTDSPIRRNYRGGAWGPEMFLILRRSYLTLNKHIAIAENNANNMRLFEATGMGACLITDWKENLHDLFEPGKEVIAYRSVEECLDLMRYFCEHPAERERIAEAGQARCLRDHTYQQRMVELTAVLMRYFK